MFVCCAQQLLDFKKTRVCCHPGVSRAVCDLERVVPYFYCADGFFHCTVAVKMSFKSLLYSGADAMLHGVDGHLQCKIPCGPNQFERFRGFWN